MNLKQNLSEAVIAYIQNHGSESMNEVVKYSKLCQDFYLKHKHLNRNDKCICGSGKKFKHCCLLKKPM